MADPRYSYQFTADAPPLAFPASQGYVPVDYVPPALPDLELNQLLNGQPTGVSPFGPPVTPTDFVPYLTDGNPDDYGGLPEWDDLAYAVSAPAGAYAAYRTGYNAAQPAPQSALPAGAYRTALPVGNDPLALPPRPTFATPRERAMYDLENAAFRERFSPNRVQYPPNTWIGIENVYEPFDSARRKIINRGDRFRAGTYTPGKYELTPEERGTWNRNADSQMDQDARRAKKPPKEVGLGSQGKAAVDRLSQYAKRAGGAALNALGITGLLSNIANPDPFDPLGQMIIRMNPEAYPEQVARYNEYINQPI